MCPWAVDRVDVSEDPLCRGTEPLAFLAVYLVDPHSLSYSGTMPKSRDWLSASLMDSAPRLIMSSGMAMSTDILDASTLALRMLKVKVSSWP